jgi:two-component system response regulator YesN
MKPQTGKHRKLAYQSLFMIELGNGIGLIDSRWLIKEGAFLITTLLADDDIMALEYLEELIPWESYGFHIAGRATDGAQAYRLYNRLKPRLIITDVQMPAMNGLDFASLVRETDSTARIIFLSSFKDTEYLLTALRIGADDYILKHELDEKRLLDKLMKVSRDLRSEAYNVQMAFGKVIADHLERGSELPPPDQTDIGRLLDRSYQAILLEEDSILPPAADYFGLDVPIRFLAEIIDNCSEKSGLPTITIKFSKNRYLLMVSPVESASDLRAISELHAYVRRLQIWLEEQTGSTFSMIFSAEACPPSQFKRVWLKMNDGLEAGRFTQTGFCLAVSDAASCGSVGQPRPMTELEAALDKGDPEEMDQMLQARINILCQARDTTIASIFCVRCLELLTRKGNETTDIETGSGFLLPTAGTIKGRASAVNWLTWEKLMNYVADQLVSLCALIGKNKAKGYPASVLEAIEFIRSRYHHPDLSVEDIASHVGRGRNRFGLLFKEKTQYTIADYLTRFRIQKAIDLINSDRYKMYEISAMVGYTTSQYFSKVFKKVVGMTPYEYKISATANKEGVGHESVCLETNHRTENFASGTDD